MATTPTRNGITLDQFNDVMRTSTVWRDTIARMTGTSPDALPTRIRLSDGQRRELRGVLQQNGMQFDRGMEVDPAGNINQDQRPGRTILIGAAVAGAALTGLGAAGIGPLADLMGGGAAAAGGGTSAAAGGAGSIPASILATAPTTASALGLAPHVASAAARGIPWSSVVGAGLQYGLPAATNYFGARAQANAQRDSDAVMADYYNRALDAAREEQQYRRGFDENERDYSRGFNEDARDYSRRVDSFDRGGREEEIQYGRARDDYGRLSDEERLAYDRAQQVEGRNYDRSQYANFVETLEPYRMAGAQGVDYASRLLGRGGSPDVGSYRNLAQTARSSVTPVPTVPNRPTWNYSGTRPTWEGGPAPSPQSPAPGPAGAPPLAGAGPGWAPSDGVADLVLVQSPDGSEERRVPRAMAAKYAALGARVMG